MPWLCLERCGDNVANDLAQLKLHASNLTAVSYEAYNVAEDGSFINNNFTDITAGSWSYIWCCQQHTGCDSCSLSLTTVPVHSDRCSRLGSEAVSHDHLCITLLVESPVSKRQGLHQHRGEDWRGIHVRWVQHR